MTRQRGELTEPEEDLLGIHRETPEEEEAARREIQDRLELRKAFLAQLMSQEMFREWLMQQLVALRTFEHPLGISPAGFPDPMATQYQMGLKAAGWHFWTLFDDAAPELTALMRREARA